MHLPDVQEVAERGGQIQEIARTFGVDWPHLIAQTVSFGVVCPLGILGLILTITRRRPALLPLFIGSYLLSLLPFFVSGRYRLALVPPMIVLAAEALCWLGEVLRARRLLPMIGALALMTFVLSAIDAGCHSTWIFGTLLVLGISTACFFERRSECI